MTHLSPAAARVMVRLGQEQASAAVEAAREFWIDTDERLGAVGTKIEAVLERVLRHTLLKENPKGSQ